MLTRQKPVVAEIAVSKLTPNLLAPNLSALNQFTLNKNLSCLRHLRKLTHPYFPKVTQAI